MSYRPIEDYAVIGDGLTAALVSRDGSIDWAPFPRFDGASIFGRILDSSRGGFFQLAPADAFTVTRRYLEGTNVLETHFTADAGEADVTDFMPLQSGRIIRRVRGRRGTLRMAVTVDARFDYGRRDPAWQPRDGGMVASSAGEFIHLYADIPWATGRDGATASFPIAAGETLWVTLAYHPADAPWQPPDAAALARALDDTCNYWREWIGRCAPSLYRDAVCRSALVLKLLTYAPTGAIVAAPTTSLPERIGGVRNWDYRYAWVRDSAFCIYAFSLLGQLQEGERFFEWLLSVVPDGPGTLQVMYGVGGERDLTERELSHLSGYEGSAPVRVGNAAFSQLQLDAYGDLLDCAYLLHKHGRTISRDLWPFLRASADHVMKIWHQPDQGIWEMRSEPKHFVASKAHCVLALRRASGLARGAGLEGNVTAWDAAAEAILAEMHVRGVDPSTGSFLQSYGSDQVDASLLALQLRKIVRPNDPNMNATIARIEHELDAARSGGNVPRGLIRRYRTSKVDDGLPPGEGIFLMCSFWLVDVYAECGRVDEARALFERLLGYANDVGLYAEEFDPFEKRHLGNFPQAFTHVALINAAAALEEASRA